MIRSQNFMFYIPVIEAATKIFRADKLGGDDLIGDLCSGFQLLVDADKGVITFESLKNNSSNGRKGEEDAYLTGGEARGKVIWCFISIKPLKSINLKPSEIDYCFKLLLFYPISGLNSKAIMAPPLDDVLLLFWIDLKGDHSLRTE
ncbi:hypothetical protein LXL04_036968 [Taraxacum kok-saghyz]